MFLGSGPMSLLGVAVATWLSHHSSSAESIESYAIGAALVIGGIGLVAKTFVKVGVQPDDAPFLLERRDRLIAFTLGAVCGFVVGLTSVGSGTFFGLVMVMVFPLTLAEDRRHRHLPRGRAAVGRGLRPPRRGERRPARDGVAADRLDPRDPADEPLHAEGARRALRLGLACVLMLSGIKLIDFAGATYVIAVGAVVAAIGFALWGLVARLGRRPRPEVAA